jgi:hypothetical protein
MNIGQRLHALVESKRVAASGVAGFGYDQAIGEIHSNGFKNIPKQLVIQKFWSNIKKIMGYHESFIDAIACPRTLPVWL